MKDVKIMKLAKKRVRARHEFLTHLAMCTAVSIMLLIIYFIATPRKFFWPILPIIGLVISLVAYIPAVFSHFNIFKFEEKVQAEYDRLKQKRNNNKFSV